MELNEAVSNITMSFRDEMDLRAYFAVQSPAPPGSGSHFGPMCDRVSSGPKGRSDEQPTPLVVHEDGSVSGAAWTEIVECPRGGPYGVRADTEDAFVAYVDAQRRAGRVRRVLARLTNGEVDVLEAYYGADTARPHPLDRIAELTEAARRANRERAAAGSHETIGETLKHLLGAGKGAATPKTEREAAHKALLQIRRERTELLAQAQTRYARARAEGAACR